jgi:hypothetical protein
MDHDQSIRIVTPYHSTIVFSRKNQKITTGIEVTFVVKRHLSALITRRMAFYGYR